MDFPEPPGIFAGRFFVYELAKSLVNVYDAQMPMGITKGDRPCHETLFEDTRREGDCWLYTRSKAGGVYKYGRVHYHGKNMQATHVVWEKTHGTSVPKGKQVCHTCDRPLCINPDHLFVGDRWDNFEDARRKRRTPFGSRNGCAKLTDKDVRWIRVMYVKHDRKLGGGAMARKFGVCEQLIIQIIQRKIWTHI